MDMIRGAHTRQGGSMFAASVARSLLVRGPSAGGPDADPPLGSFIHDGSSGHVALWWGPVVSIQPGDRVYYVSTPAGMALERVEGREVAEGGVEVSEDEAEAGVDEGPSEDEEFDMELMLAMGRHGRAGG